MKPLITYCIRLIFLMSVATLLFEATAAGQESYRLTLSTFYGGSGSGQARDVAVDQHGNVYIVGGTDSTNFPRVPSGIGSAHQGLYDVFVTKLSPSGNVVWSRLIGGPNYDRAYAIEVDSQGNAYIGGRAGPGYPTTSGVVQAGFGGDSNPNTLYGLQDGFITKLSPDGTRIIWSTFFGGNDRSFFRDIDIDNSGNVYGALTSVSLSNPHVTAGAYQDQTDRQNGRVNGQFGVIAKISADGRSVVWASYLASADSNVKGGVPSIRAERSTGEVVVSGATNSPGMSTKNGLMGFQGGGPGNFDLHIARFLANGSDLVFGTYLGGSSGGEVGDTHNLALDAQGNVIVAAVTDSSNFPTTPGALQRTYGGHRFKDFNQWGDGFVSKISANGSTLLASTYIGGPDGEGLEGVMVDGQGNVYISGGTHSKNGSFPTTASSTHSTRNDNADLFVAKLSPDLSILLYSTVIGSGGYKEAGRDLGLAIALDSKNVFYAVGESHTANFPLVNPLDSTLGGAKDPVFLRFELQQSDTTAPAAPKSLRLKGF